MPATVRHVTRINSHTTLCAARAASHAQLSSNACVNRAPARAHGTAATTTPHRRHSTRGAGASRSTIIVPESKDRHRRTPPPASYPRHRRPRGEHRDLATPVGRTEITSTSSSVPSSPSNQNPSTVVRSTRRTFRHTLDARTPFPVPVVLTSTARNPTGHGVSPNPCQETHPRQRHKGLKVRVREEARSRRSPVLMQTSDRGLFDVERFDQEPDRDLFHGLLGALDPQALGNLTTHDKAPHVMRILEAPALSARMAASMVEIDRSISTWPQLGGDVQLGAATVAAAVRRYGCGEDLPSGRIRIDLDSAFDELRRPEESAAPLPVDDDQATDLTRQIPEGAVDAVIHAIRLGPSGGNSQPWKISATPSSVDIHLPAARTSAMDIGFRGSYLAIGAAAFNARVAAAKHSVLGSVKEFPEGPDSDVIMSITLGHHTDTSLAVQYPAMIQRISNRTIGRRAPLSDRLVADLQVAAQAEGAVLHLVTDPDQLTLLADVLAESDRLRFLTPLLHEQMISELKWPGLDRLDVGIDVRTLGVDAGELAKLQVASRSDVIAYLAAWGVGHALGDGTRERILRSSAVAVIAIDGDTPRDYLRGGAAAERVWIRAGQDGLGVQPVSPVFLYARTDDELRGLSARFSTELAELQHRFDRIVGLGARQALALVIRISHDPGSVVRSRRRARASIVSTVCPQ